MRICDLCKTLDDNVQEVLVPRVLPTSSTASMDYWPVDLCYTHRLRLIAFLNEQRRALGDFLHLPGWW